MVVDKEAGMCVHPAGGLNSGTLVNAMLHHFGREEVVGGEGEADEEDDEFAASAQRERSQGIVRPGTSNITSVITLLHAHLQASSTDLIDSPRE